MAALLFGLPATLLAAPDGAELLGVWRNPKDSVHVEFAPCGERLCGRVVWASDKAIAKARKAGTDPLMGVQLLRGFTRVKADQWRGTVFVPDLRKTVSGTLTLVDPDTLRARSCTLELLCKTQLWERIG